MLIIPQQVIYDEDNLSGLEILKKIERIGRTCYKSEDKITDDSCYRFVKMLIDRGHEAMIEHVSLSFKITTDRGITHELVRHRLASWAQESTRYVNYSKDPDKVRVIDISTAFDIDKQSETFIQTMSSAQQSIDTYLALTSSGVAPELARDVLPNIIASDIWMTMNLRVLRNFLSLRCAPSAHPSMRELAKMILSLVYEQVPVVFDDLAKKYLVC